MPGRVRSGLCRSRQGRACFFQGRGKMGPDQFKHARSRSPLRVLTKAAREHGLKIRGEVKVKKSSWRARSEGSCIGCIHLILLLACSCLSPVYVAAKPAGGWHRLSPAVAPLISPQAVYRSAPFCPTFLLLPLSASSHHPQTWTTHPHHTPYCWPHTSGRSGCRTGAERGWRSHAARQQQQPQAAAVPG